MTSKDHILEVLNKSSKWLATHEIEIMGYSQNNLATRLSELAKAGKVQGRFRKGKNFKEWAIASCPKLAIEFKTEPNGQMVFE